MEVSKGGEAQLSPFGRVRAGSSRAAIYNKERSGYLEVKSTRGGLSG